MRQFCTSVFRRQLFNTFSSQGGTIIFGMQSEQTKFPIDNCVMPLFFRSSRSLQEEMFASKMESDMFNVSPDSKFSPWECQKARSDQDRFCCLCYFSLLKIFYFLRSIITITELNWTDAFVSFEERTSFLSYNLMPTLSCG